MKLEPMNDPRPGQAAICIECSKPIYADRETILCDMEGVPFKAYYHEACIPAFREWMYYEEIGGYFFWKYQDEDDKTVYNVTKEPKPPTNEAGYYSYGYLLKVKGLIPGVTLNGIFNEEH